MRHQRGSRLPAAAAALILALTVHASAALTTAKDPAPAEKPKAEKPEREDKPDRADLAQQRFSLVESMEGWQAMTHAQEGFAPLAAKFDALKAELAGFELGRDLGAASKTLESKREAFEALKAEYLSLLFAARSGGRKLAEASPEERARFGALTQAQADTFKELAHRPLAKGPELTALQGQVLKSESTSWLGRMFDNAFGRQAVPAGPVAETIDAAPAAPSGYAPSYRSPSAPVSHPKESPLGRSEAMATYPIAHPKESPLGQARREAPPTPSVFSSQVEPEPVPSGAPSASDHSKDAKRAWQRELLRRTGAWAVLSAVGVDPERFVAALTGAESNYATNTTSWAGAAGLMQVMPDTARAIMSGAKYRQLAREYGLTVYSTGMSNAAIQRMLNRDWRTCALLGILYINDQAQTFVGYAKNLGVSMNDKAKLMMNMVAGAYNAGPGRVWQAFKRLRRQGLWLDDVNPGQSLVQISETKNYVKKILRDYTSYLGK